MGLKTEKSSMRVSMRDFCHEASPFLRVLTHSLKTNILKQVFILRDSFQLAFTFVFHKFLCGTLLFLA